MSEFKNKFGKRLCELRKARGFSQEFFAELIGIAPRNLSKIETGKTFPTIENLEKIIKCLGCKASVLFEFEHLASKDVIQSEIIHKIKKLNPDKLQLLYKILCAIE